MPQAVARTVLAPRLSSVSAARRWVRSACLRCCGSLTDSTVVALLTTEVVANAVLHGHGDVVLELACGDGVVQVAVSDASPDLPVLRRAPPEAVGGRGVALVDTLASRWGVQTPARTAAEAGTGTGTGKTVWFELLTGT
jgi:anti-sigma regulatory factor (Ser/Thr protein kinase)